ncbi:hypothetical protein [Paludibacterium denitrificans]|uniref:Uncharacterized protein n=1 Tax=Paludibacterium denitrificans TaxID=2675226 RepID=A0A844GFK5_9NEIS|nr:hypothetical protein [Paludibacterium denitrificans]MTD34100.1 hypothetical protein [Paludibacterium denitrificans]
MNDQTLMLDGVPIPILAGLDLSQSYEEIGGKTLLRTRSGKAVSQARWKRLKTTVQGGGWIPAPLAGLDTAVPHTLDCIVPRVVPIGTVVSERPDLPGFEMEGGYQYWPRLTGYLTVSDSGDVRNAGYTWSITLEEE